MKTGFKHRCGGALAAVFLASQVAAQTNSLPGSDPFPGTFDKVVELIEADELTGMEMAKGTYHATRLFATGARTLPYVQQRFLGAGRESEAALGGLYMTVHGNDVHLQRILRELETSRQKRAWLKREVGSEAAFFASVDEGEYWRDFLPLLPSTRGAARLSRMCMASEDALVRRAGMLWGSFFPDAGYGAALRNIASSDPDPATRRIADRLRGRLSRSGADH
jgi:hypothetical protein